jgi:hypothetical protein
MESINVMALDENFNLVTLLRYANLQWSRKYHECGTFSMQIPLEQYDPSFKYIYTKDRPEVGKITQINYTEQSGYRSIQLSGFFMENELNRMVVYAKGAGNIVGGPEWADLIGPAESVAFGFFNAFSTIRFDNATYGIGVLPGADLGRGSQAHHSRDNSYLGNKVYHILKPSGMSYRVLYDFERNTKAFTVWSGVDRSEEQTSNNPVVFSTRYGNIKNPNILIDDSTYKSGCVVVNQSTSGDATVTYTRAVIDPDESEGDNAFLALGSSATPNDFTSMDEFFAAMEAEGRSEKNSSWTRTMNVEFDAVSGSYEYMQDFDLGDICSVEIQEVGVSADARLIGCYEVIKQGVWTLTMEFGTPIIKR